MPSDGPRHRILRMSDLDRRGSWCPTDFIYRRGEKVTLNSGIPAIVTGQDDDDVFVAEVWRVPGSSTPIACSLPRRVTIHDIKRRTQSTAERRRS